MDRRRFLQVADHPDRNEPTTGEIDYRHVFAHLHEKGYDGIVSMEHSMSCTEKLANSPWSTRTPRSTPPMTSNRLRPPMPIRSLFANVLLLAIGTALLVPTAPAQDSDPVSILVFSKTNGYRHASIPSGIDALKELGDKHGFRVEATEDSTTFRPDRLAEFDVVVFLNTSGNVLGSAGQEALRTFVEQGGGFVGVHAASDTEFNWPWYGRLVGAYFDGHPDVQEATVRVEDATHPSTSMLPPEWSRRDEWYNFNTNPRDSVQVLLTLDEATYEGGTMGDDHPIAWCHTQEEGRAWYTAGGHTKAAYRASLFRQHLLGGLRWAAGTD